MKSIISINKKFFSINPKDLCLIIKNHKYTNGVEIYIDYNKDEEIKYLNDLVFELKKNSLILQVHGEIELKLEKQYEFIKKLESYADYLDYPIVVTFHPIYDEDKKVSINKTVEYLELLFKNIDTSKIRVCLENLNDIRGFIRLSKEEIKSTVLNDEKLYFTYDIGHEISNYGDITNLDGYMFSEIRNVHLHSVSINGIDHMPIYKEDLNWNKIIKALEFLIINKYEYNIVYEYGLEYCRGDNVLDKLNDYLLSIDIVSEKYII